MSDKGPPGQRMMVLPAQGSRNGQRKDHKCHLISRCNRGIHYRCQHCCQSDRADETYHEDSVWSDSQGASNTNSTTLLSIWKSIYIQLQASMYTHKIRYSSLLNGVGRDGPQLRTLLFYPCQSTIFTYRTTSGWMIWENLAMVHQTQFQGIQKAKIIELTDSTR